MQPLMTYSQNNNLQQYQSMYQPYTDRYMPVQQYQQIMSPTSMSGTSQFTPLGKIVESMDIVKVTDIPMDGNMYYFPKADGQAIYGKKFLPNGQTQILAFKPSLESEPNNVSSETEKTKFDTLNEFLVGIQNEVRSLSDKIDKIAKPTRVKKGEVEDE